MQLASRSLELNIEKYSVAIARRICYQMTAILTEDHLIQSVVITDDNAPTRKMVISSVQLKRTLENLPHVFYKMKF